MDITLWQPNDYDLTASHMARFMRFLNEHYQKNITNYAELHAFSIADKNSFWQAMWRYAQITSSPLPASVISNDTDIRKAVWFDSVTLNFTDNLLSRHDNHIAIHYAREDGYRRSISYHELTHAVYVLAAQFKSLGIKAGDRVAGFMTNRPETVIAMLATALLGGIWSSCSPDFGLDGVLDRFAQIEPKVLIAVNEHSYNSKKFNHAHVIAQVKQQIHSINQVLIIDHHTLDHWLAQPKPDLPIELFPFDHPLYILYSSGTTGKPKCMVHGAGGTLVQHVKELMLHSDLHAKDTLFFYTTCGWMMWNWLVSGLAVGATLVLYDGAPLPEHNKALLYDLIDEFDITHFGVGAKFLESSQSCHLNPNATQTLKQLRVILTTGSPLLPSSFDYVYEQIKTDVRLSSIAGGSDIISCFAVGNPLLPVYRGELQCIGLGMDVHVFNSAGQPVIGEQGELVCTSAFPSRPIYFWHDPDGALYQKAYFAQFPNVWTHGDYVALTQHGGLIIYGRSDATLNPGGVRIGTADIYKQVAKISEVVECAAVGKECNGNEEIILFVVLKNGLTLSDALISNIKHEIRQNASPMHVPTKIIQAPELPRTVSGKVVELAIKQIINQRPVVNVSALANPEALAFFKGWEYHP